MPSIKDTLAELQRDMAASIEKVNQSSDDRDAIVDCRDIASAVSSIFNVSRDLTEETPYTWPIIATLSHIVYEIDSAILDQPENGFPIEWYDDFLGYTAYLKNIVHPNRTDTPITALVRGLLEAIQTFIMGTRMRAVDSGAESVVQAIDKYLARLGVKTYIDAGALFQSMDYRDEDGDPGTVIVSRRERDFN